MVNRAALVLDHELTASHAHRMAGNGSQDLDAVLSRIEQAGVVATIFADPAGLAVLQSQDSAAASEIVAQWSRALERGHGVELFVDARRAREDEDWIGRLRDALHANLSTVAPHHRVGAVRIRGLGAIPFRPVYAALERAGIGADCSVRTKVHRRRARVGDPLIYSNHQPYFASRSNAALKGPPAERAVVELPEVTDAGRFADAAGAKRTSRPRRTGALDTKLRALWNSAYAALAARPRLTNRLIPRSAAYWLAPYEPDNDLEDQYFLFSLGSVASVAVAAVDHRLDRLADTFAVEPVSALVERARRGLEAAQRPTPEAEAELQVRGSAPAVLSEKRNTAQSARLQALIPGDSARVLDLGCGAGYWLARIATLRAPVEVVGIDVGEQFIETARRMHSSPSVSFEVAEFTELPFADGSFDCVYADNTLEHAYDVDATLSEVRRVLSAGGVLVAASPSDARNPLRSCVTHTWKSAPADYRERLQAAGFDEIEIEEVDVYRTLGMPPFPPALDQMMYVRARAEPYVAVGANGAIRPAVREPTR